MPAASEAAALPGGTEAPLTPESDAAIIVVHPALVAALNGAYSPSMVMAGGGNGNGNLTAAAGGGGDPGTNNQGLTAPAVLGSDQNGLTPSGGSGGVPAKPPATGGGSQQPVVPLKVGFPSKEFKDYYLKKIRRQVPNSTKATKMKDEDIYPFKCPPQVSK